MALAVSRMSRPQPAAAKVWVGETIAMPPPRPVQDGAAHSAAHLPLAQQFVRLLEGHGQERQEAERARAAETRILDRITQLAT